MRWKCYHYVMGHGKKHPPQTSSFALSHSHGHILFNEPALFHKFWCDVTASSLAFIAVAPFNYLRNIKMAVLATERTPSAGACFSQLLLEARREKNLLLSLNYIQKRFVLGWGLLQLGPRIAFTQLLFDYLNDFYETKREQQEASKSKVQKGVTQIVEVR